jgi:membrane fusion protein (multidrug efflux system)
VSVTTVEQKDVPVVTSSSPDHGFHEVEVRARCQLLIKRNFREGGAVKQGDVFTIDPEPFRVALSRAEADLAVAEARRAQANREAARLRPVLELKAVSQKELDDAVSAEQIAEAEVKSARARVNEARLNLEYTRVESPISGTTSRAVASEGTLVSGPGVLLTTVTQTDPMYVIFGIPDRERLAMRRDVDAGRLKCRRMAASGDHQACRRECPRRTSRRLPTSVNKPALQRRAPGRIRTDCCARASSSALCCTTRCARARSWCRSAR